ncbi:MAG TPA: LptF/LptG family permease [Desulfovibrio sp.]|uniref:LptF/LptG family permease n=1 Tax=Desulfovibrio TaxID=872 RepID=UPI00041FDDCD|nr:MULTISPECIES: LptF/LptG family permease [Desulfovibrio]MDY0307730.1 LptF/LptG family permease [Desulfovibrionaceae bacterium]HMM38586.1 LptF/LptG family permease [Desulfovibrio sp.]
MTGRVFGVLGRYLARQNLFLILMCLCVGTGIYLLSDLFDRVDDFVSAGLGLGSILTYFAVKLPVILSQILPAVFLLALVVQLGLLSRSRELMALRAGGLSPSWFTRFFLIYALAWSLVQFGFSQVLGVYGEREAGRIWKEDVRKKQMDKLTLKNLWFRDGAYIVEMDEGVVARNQATGVTVYEFDTESQKLVRILSARAAEGGSGGWSLNGVTILDTASFLSSQEDSLSLPLHQELKAFAAADQSESQTLLPIWQLSKTIDELRESGSNVERLRTAWHSRFSYAFSIAIMALLALALTSWSENLYLNLGLSLSLVFVQYGMHAVGVTAGDKGLLPPFIAAWLGNILFGLAAGGRLLWISCPRLEKEVKARLEPWLRRLRR